MDARVGTASDDAENRIWVHSDGQIASGELTLPKNRPLGWATISSDCHEIDGRTVASVFGRLGAERLPRRFGILIGESERQSVAERLNQLLERGAYFDRAWLLLHGICEIDGTAVSHCYVGLVTRSQLEALGPNWPLARCTLDNGRVLKGIDTRAAPERLTLEQEGATYLTETSTKDNEIRLVTVPSNPFAELLRDAHSYYCVLNSAHRSKFDANYVYIRNILLEADYSGLHAVATVRPLFDKRVGETRIVLDSTTHAAIGLPQGEPVGLGVALGRAPRVRAAVFGNRHCVARVGRTATVDIEKAVTRLPDEVFDLLDIKSNERVVVEAVQPNPDPRISRITLRALPWRFRSPLLDARTGAGVPDYQQLVGDEDFPTISLDLISRERLGITPGSAVYLRPAVSSEIARQFATVSLALMAAVLSAAVLRNVELAVILGVLYVFLTIGIIARRLRQ